MSKFHLFILVFGLVSGLVKGQQVSQQQEQQQQQQQIPPRRNLLATLHESEECSYDINRLCAQGNSKRILSNIQVLQCIYNNVQDYNTIDKKCQNLIYEAKKNLTINLKLDNSALSICKDDLVKIPECQITGEENGHLTSCLINNRDNITNPNCQQFIKSIAALVFTDYRLIYKFVSHCENDIKKFSCGRLEKEDEDNPTQQGQTITCLSSKITLLETECKKQIFRVIELQSDDFHLDRTLYFACREDREKMCDRIQSGQGRVLDCLFRNKFNALMSKGCVEQLTRRQKVIAEDYTVDRGLVLACKRDIHEHKCRGELRENKTESVKLASLILCLEGAIRDGEKLDSDCRAKLVQHRKSLMTDYQISPDIVKNCDQEVKNYCGGGLERGGKTLKCLIRVGKQSLTKQSKIDFSTGCIGELKNLLKITDASEDISVDPDLQESCQNLIENQCKNVRQGEGRVINCLLGYLNKPEMNSDCEERLLDIQFFVSRDWKLTPMLYKACKEDAVKNCKAKPNWQDWTTDVDNGPLVLPCLYHLIHDDNDDDGSAEKKNQSDEDDKTEVKERKVSKECAFQVKKVMDYRAESIDLMPEIQDQCSNDLAAYCSKVNLKNKGEELICLQKNLKSLEDDCRETILKFSKSQNEDISLDKILMKACMPTVDEFCSTKKEEKGDLLECLIRQKNNPKMDEKCRIGIEHHQLLNMENVQLNFKFFRGCKDEIREHCQGLKSKLEVVQCLSEIVLNDTLIEDEHRITEKCRSQLRFELLQLNENIKLDPLLFQACKEDALKLCKNVKPGKGQVLECLRSQSKELSDECKLKLFKRDKINVVEQNADYVLQSKCKSSIEKFCDNSEDVLSCLRKNLAKPSFDQACRSVVINRIATQNSDITLNPTLWKACSADVNQNCFNEYSNLKLSGDNLKGRVISCLKKVFVKDGLSQVCSMEIEQIMREAANIDYRLDPLLAKECLNEIEIHCSSAPNDKKEDCLRLSFQKGKIERGNGCFDEIRRIIIEGAADVFVDRELSQLCSIDLNRFCSDVAVGSAQQLKCLLSHKDTPKDKISAKCAEKLSSRQQLWEMADVPDSLTSFRELADYINKSEHRSYFLFSFFFIALAIFGIGCICRPAVSKHRHTKLK
ncbi:unnamed protein product [Brachionus calyciflorus]|uniref:Golgi apparatus protein 1 n=1 Tax=Brachionus calyciflorus TaxID=104777 RepID=A0A814EKC0_9BILA|nr:unnamed protein product [Brachionus calyciflorus]